jgi:hypothetical protein
MALQIVLQPQSVLVPQYTASVTFSTSGIDLTSPANTVTYQWRRKDTGVSTNYVDIGSDSPTLTLTPIEEYDNDTFVVLVSGITVAQSLTSNEVTFGIRLSSAQYSDWETLTESGVDRVRRLQVLGYL